MTGVDPKILRAATDYAHDICGISDFTASSFRALRQPRYDLPFIGIWQKRGQPLFVNRGHFYGYLEWKFHGTRYSQNAPKRTDAEYQAIYTPGSGRLQPHFFAPDKNHGWGPEGPPKK